MFFCFDNKEEIWKEMNSYVKIFLLLFLLISYAVTCQPAIHDSSSFILNSISADPVDKIKFVSSPLQYWNNLKKSFGESGINLSFQMKNEIFSNEYGGIETGSVYLNNFYITTNFDLEKVFGFKKTTVFSQILGVHGNIADEKVGSIQGISNIAAHHQWRFFQLWIEKKIIEEKLSLLFGLYDLNSEFDLRVSSGIFTNPSIAIGAEFEKSGLNGPSIFPASSLSFRIKYKPNNNFYFLAGILDGAPGNYDEPYFTHVIAKRSDGYLLVGELNYLENGEELKDGYGKYSIGSWIYTAPFSEPGAVNDFFSPQVHNDNSGIYLFAEKFFNLSSSNPKTGISTWFRYGYAHGPVNPIQSYISLGINLIGMIGSADDEILGITMENSRLSDTFLASESMAEFINKENETVFELTYSRNLFDCIRLQPDIQFVLHPTFSTSNSALVIGTRIEINL